VWPFEKRERKEVINSASHSRDPQSHAQAIEDIHEQVQMLKAQADTLIAGLNYIDLRLQVFRLEKGEKRNKSSSVPVLSDAGLTPLECAERDVILKHLLKNKWNQAKSSREVGIRQNTMILKMRKYGLKAPEGLVRRGRREGRVEISTPPQELTGG